MSIQYTSDSLTCVDYSNNTTAANIKNCELLNSHLHRVDLFSDLSRNMTPSSSSSSDLFEDAEITGKEDIESNTEADNSPSLSPSDLFEDTKATEEGQDDVESNADDNTQEQDVITSEKSPEGNDNTIDSQLTNST